MRPLPSLLLLVVLAALANSLEGPCNNGHELFSECSCNSGFVGPNCDPTLQKCTFPTVAPLSISRVAELTPPTWQEGLLQVEVTSPATEGRYFEYISMKKSGWDDDCSYPGPQFSKSFLNTTCTDVFKGEFNLPSLVQSCGFEEVQGEPGFHSYEGGVYVFAHDLLTSLRGHAVSRSVKASHRILLEFPSSVTLNVSDLTLFTEVDLQAALTRQEFDPVNSTVLIEITSVVQWPYQLSLQGQEGPTVSDCAPSEGALPDCIQTTTFIFTVSPSEGCSLNASYNVPWTIVCRQNCVQPTEAPSVSFSVAVEDFCPRASIIASLSGDLRSYRDHEHNIDSTIFISGGSIFFLASLQASVELEAIVINNLEIVVDGQTKVLLSEGEPTSLGADSGFQVDEQGNLSELSFQFNAIEGLFSGQETFAFDVKVELDVVYSTSFFSRRRGVLQSTIEVSSSLILDASKASKAPNAPNAPKATTSGLLGWLFG